MNSTTQEIERKFVLLNTVGPELKDLIRGADWEEITQIYLADNNQGIARLRKCKTPLLGISYTLTIKSSGGMVRDEIEVEVRIPDEATFDRIGRMGLVVGKEIKKRRYTVASDNGEWLEVDVFEGHLENLVLVEKEFPSIEKAQEWTVPEFLRMRLREVTEDFRFTNVALAKVDAPPLL